MSALPLAKSEQLKVPKELLSLLRIKESHDGDLAINRSILEDTVGKERGKEGTTRGKKCPGFAWEATQEQMSSHSLFYYIVGICSKEDTFLHHPLLSTTSSLSILPSSVLRLDLFATLVPPCNSSPACLLLFCWDRITYLFTTQNRVILLVFE